jgi:hypothetical protein
MLARGAGPPPRNGRAPRSPPAGHGWSASPCSKACRLPAPAHCWEFLVRRKTDATGGQFVLFGRSSEVEFGRRRSSYGLLTRGDLRALSNPPSGNRGPLNRTTNQFQQAALFIVAERKDQSRNPRRGKWCGENPESAERSAVFRAFSPTSLPGKYYHKWRLYSRALPRGHHVRLEDLQTGPPDSA